MAISRSHIEIAGIIASKGAKCTELEIAMLGEKYPFFISLQQQQEETGPVTQASASPKGQATQGKEEDKNTG